LLARGTDFEKRREGGNHFLRKHEGPLIAEKLTGKRKRKPRAPGRGRVFNH